MTTTEESLRGDITLVGGVLGGVLAVFLCLIIGAYYWINKLQNEIDRMKGSHLIPRATSQYMHPASPIKNQRRTLLNDPLSHYDSYPRDNHQHNSGSGGGGLNARFNQHQQHQNSPKLSISNDNFTFGNTTPSLFDNRSRHIMQNENNGFY